MTWQLAAAGLVVGCLAGATGMGGGSLMTPLLVLAFGFDPTVAVGTDLLHGALFKTVGALRHRRLGTVQAQLSGWMFVGSAPTSLLGVALATWLRHRYGSDASSVEARALAAALIAGGLGTFFKSATRFKDAPDGPLRLTSRDRFAAVLIGLVGGFVVGLTSVGSGVFFALTLLIVFPLRSAKVVGTDVLHAAALLWVAGLGHLAAGNVDLRAVAWLLVGSVPGVLIGAQLVVKASDRLLRRGLALVLLLSGMRMLEPPHPAATLVAAAGAGTMAVVVTARLRRRRSAAPRIAVDP